MSRLIRNLNGFLMGVCFVALLAFCADVQAGDDIIQSNDNNNQTAGDVLLSGGENTANNSAHIDGSRSLALGNSLGDVDIAQCLGSTQWNTPLFGKQKLVLNWPCMAEFYLTNNKYDLAAMAICNTEVLSEFAGEAECEAAHDFTPTVEPQAEIIPDPRIDALYARISDLEAEAAKAQEIHEKAADQPVRPRVIERTVVEQKPLLTAEKRARLQAILDE